MRFVSPSVPSSTPWDDRHAILRVRVEQLRRCFALDHHGQLPTQVDHVLDTRIHTLAARRTVDVRRVATKKDAPFMKLWDHAAVDTEITAPNQNHENGRECESAGCK